METNKPAERSPLLPLITGVFVAILVLTPSASAKFIALGPLNIAGSTLFFPISYIFGDVLTEVYGYERSRRIIWIGFACQVFAAIMYMLIDIWPAAPFWHNQEAFSSVLGQAPRIVAASLIAYFFGEFSNSFIVSRLKFAQRGKKGAALATRFVASTIVAEFFDSALFMFIGFYGVLGTSDIIKTVLTIWVLKSAYEIVMLPASMSFVGWIKRREGIDVTDNPHSTRYNPFSLK